MQKAQVGSINFEWLSIEHRVRTVSYVFSMPLALCPLPEASATRLTFKAYSKKLLGICIQPE